MRLLGITGRAKSGKDTVGEYLQKAHQYKQYAFADPIKKAAHEMFGIPLEAFYDQSLKEIIIPEWGFTPRKILQLLGTEAGREIFDNDMWVKRGEIEWNNLKKEYSNIITTQEITLHTKMAFEAPIRIPSGLVITDIRFENEAAMIRRRGGKVLHMYRDDLEEIETHVSEAGIKMHDDDYIIDNNGSLADLVNIVDNMIEILQYD